MGTKVGSGLERQFAEPPKYGVPALELLDWAMTAIVTKQPLAATALNRPRPAAPSCAADGSFMRIADVPDKLDVVQEPANLNSIKPSTDHARLLDTTTCTS